MEVLTILLSALLGILSPVGIVTDTIAENAIRDQFDSVDALAIRIDNTPNYQLLRGQVDRVRIAGRGLSPIEGIRIDTLEVETDAIVLNPASLTQGTPELEQPLQVAIKLVLTEEDIRQALQSEEITDQLDDLNLDFFAGSPVQNYAFVNPQVEFLDNNRLRFQITLQGQQPGDRFQLSAESGLNIVSGRQLQLVNPVVSIDEELLPAEVVNLLIEGISQRLDLANLEDSGITARVLKLEMEGDRLICVSFVRVEPGMLGVER